MVNVFLNNAASLYLLGTYSATATERMTSGGGGGDSEG